MRKIYREPCIFCGFWRRSDLKKKFHTDLKFPSQDLEKYWKKIEKSLSSDLLWESQKSTRCRLMSFGYTTLFFKKRVYFSKRHLATFFIGCRLMSFSVYWWALLFLAFWTVADSPEMFCKICFGGQIGRYKLLYNLHNFINKARFY